jgi:hypothetical protein
MKDWYRREKKGGRKNGRIKHKKIFIPSAEQYLEQED